ncbi:MAG: hypothetical protein R6X32_09885 [Chloroflexota bacterium]|jgi:predicted ABC-type transport system involved in lysophospholipase L1 biosynthesis ATPase subunit
MKLRSRPFCQRMVSANARAIAAHPALILADKPAGDQEGTTYA